MKNLLIYTCPNKKFDEETSILAKIQIENCFDLGWKTSDILLFSDFTYKYMGIEAQVIPDKLFYDFDKSSNKIPVIIYLIENKILSNDVIYWYHDFDCYQQEKLNEKEIISGNIDLAIVPYGYKPQWNLGSFFFTNKALDIFKKIEDTIYTKRKSDNRCDEKALQRLLYARKIPQDRYQELNVTYNFTKRCIATNFKQAKKPIKVLHFHPHEKDAMMPDTGINMFMHGKNSIRTKLMNERLANIFKNHSIN